MTTLRLVDIGSQVGKQPTAGTVVTIGSDLSRNKWVHAVHWDGAVRCQIITPGALEHVQALVRQYHPACPIHLVYEACGFGYELAWWAQQIGVKVTVVAPSRVERAPGAPVKTDRLDARKLATKGAAGQLKGVAIPTRSRHEQRQVLRTYGQATRDRQRAQVRLRSLMQEHGRLGPAPRSGWAVYERWLLQQELPSPVAPCVHELRQLRAAALRSAQRLRTQLLALAAHPDYAPAVQAMTTQAGVGEFTAIRLLLEIGELTRFPSTGAWSNFFGLTPSEYSTGDGPAHRGHIQKCGPRSLRAALVQCAWIAIRTDPDLRAVFDRLTPRTGKKRAIIAVTRRLALRLRARWRAAVPPPVPAT